MLYTAQGAIIHTNKSKSVETLTSQFDSRDEKLKQERKAVPTDMKI